MEHAASAWDFRWLGRALPFRSPARGRWPAVGNRGKSVKNGKAQKVWGE